MLNYLFFFEEAVRMAFRSIFGHKLRTFLTMLGITIGIFSITFIFTMVNSMQTSVTANLSSLGNTVLYVHNWPWKDNSEDWFKYFNRPKVDYTDFQKLKQNLENVEAVNIQATKDGVTLKAEDGKALEGVTVLGITYDFRKLNGLDIGKGRYFTESEIVSGRKNCIIGYNIAMNLFPSGNALGQHIRVKGKQLLIIGIMAKQGSADLFGGSNDDRVAIPYATFAGIYNTNRRSVDKVISIKATSYEKLPNVEADVIGILRAHRGIKPGQEENFSINKQEALMEQLEGIFGALNIGGSIISLFSLLVGGFGIANIMFVTVKERTTEIGVQKALGSTNAFILLQFLTEAVILCLMGGLMGILMVFGLASIGQLISNSMDLGLSIVIDPKDVMTSLMISAFIGIISGFLPAWNASRLNPVDAIRAN